MRESGEPREDACCNRNAVCSQHAAVLGISAANQSQMLSREGSRTCSGSFKEAEHVRAAFSRTQNRKSLWGELSHSREAKQLGAHGPSIDTALGVKNE